MIHERAMENSKRDQVWNCLVILSLALICFSGVVSATVVPVGPFTGDYQEGFESVPFNFHESIDVFDGNAEVLTVTGDPRVLVSGGWNDIEPYGGDKFMGVAENGEGAKWIFGTPATRFGGYFTHVLGSDAIVKFYDSDNTLIDTLEMELRHNVWAWHGWEIGGGGFKRIEIIAMHFNGNYVVHDNMECTFIPEPMTLSLLSLGGLLFRKRK